MRLSQEAVFVSLERIESFQKLAQICAQVVAFFVVLVLLLVILQCTDLLLVGRLSGGTCALCVHWTVVLKPEPCLDFGE